MEAVYVEQSPKETGWYAALKSDMTPIVFYTKNPTDEPYEIALPWDFSGNPNLRFYMNPKTWVIHELDTSTSKLLKWDPILQVLPLKGLLQPNAAVQMAYRESLIGRTITIGDDTYTIVNTSQHIHTWAIYNIQNVKTRTTKQIQLHGTDEWSFSGIDQVKVEIVEN